ncbi:hypothetical protein BJX99DRAFT_31021 [Aspergillus californicus]
MVTGQMPKIIVPLYYWCSDRTFGLELPCISGIAIIIALLQSSSWDSMAIMICPIHRLRSNATTCPKRRLAAKTIHETSLLRPNLFSAAIVLPICLGMDGLVNYLHSRFNATRLACNNISEGGHWIGHESSSAPSLPSLPSLANVLATSLRQIRKVSISCCAQW